jgi:queuine tRNA-ribosyltransferase
VRFRSYLDGSERFIAPETSMAVQAQLGSDIVLAFDECTPFNVERDYTARSTERTHRWLERCVNWRTEHAPATVRSSTGSCRAASTRTCARESLGAVLASGCAGVAIGGSLGTREGADVRGHRVVHAWARGGRSRAPRHLLGIGDVDDLIRGVELGIDSFDCAMPTRLARHGVALVPIRQTAGGSSSTARAGARAPSRCSMAVPARPARRALARLPALPRARARADRRAAAHAAQPHVHIERLMADLRSAVIDGGLERVAAALRAGATPGGD